MSSADTTFSYIGTELNVFSRAVHWKNYWFSKIAPYLGNAVLEVGAGIGGTTRVLAQRADLQLLGIEPDRAMFEHLLKLQAAGELPAHYQFQPLTVADLPADALFDSVLYIDVLEHIEDDRAEAVRALQRCRPGGYLVILSPAHPFLFAPFDAAIGHYRRYTRPMLAALTPPESKTVLSIYLDSVGLLASLGNRLLLRESTPSEGQIQFWDRWLVRTSRRVDPLFGFNLGKSVLHIWQREGRDSL